MSFLLKGFVFKNIGIYGNVDRYFDISPFVCDDDDIDR